MADKSTRERLKRQAEQARAEKIAETSPKKEAKPDEPKKNEKPVVMRSCCATPRGKGDHLHGCTVPKQKPKPKRPGLWRDHRQEKRGRLPEGASFQATYSAESERWTGALVIPGATTFGSSATGVFRLMENLDGFYRKWLAEQEQKKNAAVADVVEVA